MGTSWAGETTSGVRLPSFQPGPPLCELGDCLALPGAPCRSFRAVVETQPALSEWGLERHAHLCSKSQELLRKEFG